VWTDTVNANARHVTLHAKRLTASTTRQERVVATPTTPARPAVDHSQHLVEYVAEDHPADLITASNIPMDH